MLTFKEVKNNQQISEFIKRSGEYLKDLGYTDHGFRHVTIVADRAAKIARDLKFSAHDQESTRIAGYCHDMGNFLGRSHHHYWGGLLFHQVFSQTADVEQVADIMQAIVAHDKEELKIMSAVSAAAIIADKSDVHRSRIVNEDPKTLKTDLHQRVNNAVLDNRFDVLPKKKIIKLSLTVDTKFMEVMNYFEIFTGRMVFCRQAAEFLGYKFSLEINKFKLT